MAGASPADQVVGKLKCPGFTARLVSCSERTFHMLVHRTYHVLTIVRNFPFADELIKLLDCAHLLLTGTHAARRRKGESSMKAIGVIFGSLTLGLACFLVLAPSQVKSQNSRSPEVGRDVHHDVSLPLRELYGSVEGIEHRVIPLRHPFPVKAISNQADPILQTVQIAPLAAITPGLNFDGVGVGLGTFSDCCAPPDTNATVGTTQVVEWVNLSFAVFDKATGGLISGPKAGNAIWSGFGGQCEAHNDGDPIAQYDKAAGRWVLAQPVFESPYAYCVAVSTTSDATGSYNRYEFSMPNFPDYPKLGVWADGYYASFNIFNGNSFAGARACAFDRSAMLAGSSATQICFQESSSVASLLPSDLDGSTAPPSGEPDFFLNFGTGVLNLFKFHANFTTPADSTFIGPTVMGVAAFSEACGGGTCVPQSSTKQQLDSLGDRLMYRLAYRNIGTYESLVVNHSVQVGSGGRHGSNQTGVRWYEIRSPNGTPTIAQEGTWAPDSSFRWMGSIAEDKLGDIAVGYSASSSQMHPAIRFAVHAPSDPLGMLEPETTIIDGTGSQLRNLSRWGDYSSLTIDPSDDCTFWYSSEYLKTNGTFNWSTRLFSFKVSGC